MKPIPQFNTLFIKRATAILIVSTILIGICNGVKNGYKELRVDGSNLDAIINGVLVAYKPITWIVGLNNPGKLVRFNDNLGVQWIHDGSEVGIFIGIVSLIILTACFVKITVSGLVCLWRK